MPYDIYLSSTLDDLKDEREAARQVLGKQGISIKESYSASEKDLVSSCIEDVARCRAYVGIIGMRYGYCPAQELSNPDGKSITELEFEQARAKNIPCYVFVKSEMAVTLPQSDTHTLENQAGASIKRFRQRIGAGDKLRPSVFASVAELREQLIALASDLRRDPDDKPLMRTERTHPAELRADVGLIINPTEAADLQRHLEQVCAADRRFKRVLLAPDAPDYLATLDRSTADCRSVAWFFGPQTLGLYKEKSGLMARALADQGLRHGCVAALLGGGAGFASWPEAWPADVLVEAQDAGPAALDELLADGYAGLRTRVEAIKPDRRVRVPLLVLAMTLPEAQALAADPAALLAAPQAGLAPDEQGLRLKQIQALLASVRGPGQQPNWPLGAYGPCRHDWRPFGAAAGSAREFLAQAIGKINGGPRSKRERMLFSDDGLLLQPVHYDLDEFTHDLAGSRAALEAMRDQGGIVLVDEVSLLHPALRAPAKQFLKGENIAVLSAQPADPSPLPVSALLGPDSVLQVGNLMRRFKDDNDPRCELAINSPKRLERWLRFVLPELVPSLGEQEAQTSLLARSDALFAPTGPATLAP